MGVFPISKFLGNPYKGFIEENCHNPRTNNDIDVKLSPVTKLEKKKTAISKKSDDGVISGFMTSLSFFGFMANMKLFGSRSPDV